MWLSRRVPAYNCPSERQGVCFYGIECLPRITSSGLGHVSLVEQLLFKYQALEFHPQEQKTSKELGKHNLEANMKS